MRMISFGILLSGLLLTAADAAGGKKVDKPAATGKCPGVKKSELDDMEKLRPEELAALQERLLAAVTPRDLSAVVRASAALLVSAKRHREEVLISSSQPGGDRFIIPQWHLHPQGLEYLRRSDEVFFRYVQDNFAGGNRALLVCAAGTPLVNAIEFGELGRILEDLTRLVKTLPPKWLLPNTESVLSQMADLGTWAAAEMEKTARGALALGIDSGLVRHYLSISLFYQDKIADALAAAQEAERRQPGDSNIRDNIRIFRQMLKEARGPDSNDAHRAAQPAPAPHAP